MLRHATLVRHERGDPQSLRSRLDARNAAYDILAWVTSSGSTVGWCHSSKRLRYGRMVRSGVSARIGVQSEYRVFRPQMPGRRSPLDCRKRTSMSCSLVVDGLAGAIGPRHPQMGAGLWLLAWRGVYCTKST